MNTYQGYWTESKKMTKRQVIKALVDLGVTEINLIGKHDIDCILPNGNHAELIDPRDLWIDMMLYPTEYVPIVTPHCIEQIDSYVAPSVQIDPQTHRLESYAVYTQRVAATVQPIEKLWRLNTRGIGHNHYGDPSSLDSVLDDYSAAEDCLTLKGYRFDCDNTIWRHTTTNQWIVLSVVLADNDSPETEQKIIHPIVCADLGSMDQIPFYQSGESNQIRNALVAHLGIAPTLADTAVIEWRLLDNGAYGWIADLANGESFYWLDGEFRRPTPRAQLTPEQTKELMLQIDCFIDIVNSSFSDGDLDRAETASVYAIGLTKLIG